MSTYTSEPGTRLAGRYRLVDQVTSGTGWTYWKATDETLARSVTVLTFATGFPRVTETVTAARAASRLGDPRFCPGVRRGGRRRAGLRGAGVGGRGVAARHALRGPARSAPRGRDDGGGSAGDRGRARNRPGAPQAGPGLRALDGRRRGEDRRARHRRRAGRTGPDRVRGRRGRPGTHRHAGPGPAALRRADRLLARPAWLRRVGARQHCCRPRRRTAPACARRVRCPRASRLASTR